jgi:hypothetical protein
MRNTQIVLCLLASVALLGCGSSIIGGQDDGGDGGAHPVATCNGASSECSCTADSDCAFSVYPREATSEACFCPSPCAYNPVRTDAASARQSAYQQSCGAGSAGMGVPDGGCPAVVLCDSSNALADGGCPPGTVQCQALQARCLAGVCSGF